VAFFLMNAQLLNRKLVTKQYFEHFRQSFKCVGCCRFHRHFVKV